MATLEIMFCPKCAVEYRPGFTRCADCDVELVASLPAPKSSAGEEAYDGELLVPLWMSPDPVLHSALTAALSLAGIPFSDNPASGSPWYGLTKPEVRVPQRFYAQAKGVLDDLLATPDAPSEEYDPGAGDER